MNKIFIVVVVILDTPYPIALIVRWDILQIIILNALNVKMDFYKSLLHLN